MENPLDLTLVQYNECIGKFHIPSRSQKLVPVKIIHERLERSAGSPKF